MGRREEKRELTRQDILNAAYELFSSVGYEQTSVDDIAEKANVAKGTFYYHFEAKVDVVRALQRAALEETIVATQGMLDSGESAQSALRYLLTTRARWMEANKELAKVLVIERFARLKNPEIREHTPPLRQILMIVARAGQAGGEFRHDLDAEEMAKILVSLLTQSVATCIREGWQTSLPQRVNLWLDVLIAGIEKR